MIRNSLLACRAMLYNSVEIEWGNFETENVVFLVKQKCSRYVRELYRKIAVKKKKSKWKGEFSIVVHVG